MHVNETRPRATWRRALQLVVVLVGVLWVQEFVDTALDNRLDRYGVRPRSDEGLLGVLVAPLLHGGWPHLVGNTVPVLVLGFLVLVRGIGRGLAATAIIWLVGGLGVWLVAPTYTIHLGASGLVFGWFVYLLVRGVWTRHAGEITIGIMLFLMYGGLLLGVLPGQPGISWQSHLFGAVGGLVAAMVLDRGRRERLP